MSLSNYPDGMTGKELDRVYEPKSLTVELSVTHDTGTGIVGADLIVDVYVDSKGDMTFEDGVLHLIGNNGEELGEVEYKGNEHDQAITDRAWILYDKA